MPPSPDGRATAGDARAERTFVGRTDELSALEAFANEARNASPRLVIIEGNAGIGKSTLLRHFVAGLRSCHVLRAGGDQSEMLLPYGVIDQLVRSAGVEAAEGLTLLSVATSGELDPLAVGAELVGLLGNLQADGSLVVLTVEDMHWIDTPSAQALLFAFRRLQRDSVLVLVSGRTDELPRLGEGWTSLIGGDHRSARIHLGGLTQPELTQLAQSMGVLGLSSHAVARLLGHTDGNPLHCRALLEELSTEALNQLGSDLPAPRALAAIVFTRVAALSEPSQRFVVAAAVVGLQGPISLIASLAEVAEPVAALEELDQASLMSELTGSHRHLVAFSHSLIQRAIYDDIGPTARRELHARAADLTEGPTRLFHRASAAGGADEALAADLEAAAKEAKEGHALAQALAWLSSSAELSPVASERERRLLDAFQIAIDAGDLTTAGQMMPRLDDFAPSPRKLALVGHYSLVTGQFPAAEHLFEEAWLMTRASSEADHGAQAASSLAMYLLLIGRSNEAVAWGQRALAIVEDPALTRHIRNFLSMNLVLTGLGAEGLALLEEVPEDVTEVPRYETSGLVFRGAARLFLNDIAGARRDLTAASARHRSGLAFSFDTHGLTYLVDAEYRAGAWDEASVHADFAVSLVHVADRVWDYGFVHAHAALVPAGRGEGAAANAHIEEAWSWAEGFGVGLAMAMIVTARALTMSAQRDWAGVLTAADSIRSFGQLDTLGRPGVHNWRPLEVEAFIALEQLQDASRALGELERAIPASGLLSGEVDLWRLRALLADVRGNGAEADDAFATARRLAAGLQIPFQVALLELDDGRHAIKHGRLDDARTSLRSAHQRLRDLKAQPYIAMCEAALGEAGGHTEAAEVGPIAGLTPTELVVARLVGSGKSNREVAAELYVSVKAIEFHLSNIFGKLGIRSRREIAGLLGAAPVHL